MAEEYKYTKMVSKAEEGRGGKGRGTKLNIRTRSVRPGRVIVEFGGIYLTTIFTSAACCPKETRLGAVANISEDRIIIS